MALTAALLRRIGQNPIANLQTGNDGDGKALAGQAKVAIRRGAPWGASSAWRASDSMAAT